MTSDWRARSVSSNHGKLRQEKIIVRRAFLQFFSFAFVEHAFFRTQVLGNESTKAGLATNARGLGSRNSRFSRGSADSSAKSSVRELTKQKRTGKAVQASALRCLIRQ